MASISPMPPPSNISISSSSSFSSPSSISRACLTMMMGRRISTNIMIRHRKSSHRLSDRVKLATTRCSKDHNDDDDDNTGFNTNSIVSCDVKVGGTGCISNNYINNNNNNNSSRRRLSLGSDGVEGIGEGRGSTAAAAAAAAEEEEMGEDDYGKHEEIYAVPERLKVVALVAFVMSLCNADRVVMSVAVVPLAAKYGWSTSFLGIVQSSFLWGYLASSAVGGALADRYGGKRVMAWGAATWSLATFLTPLAAQHSVGMLLAVRILFGLAEGVALPSMNTLLSQWFPSHERASAVGISMAGFHLGNVMSFLATPVIMSMFGIEGSFALFASLGFIWLSAWLVGITNDPRDSPLISHAELRLILAGKRDSSIKSHKFLSVRQMLSKLPTWAIIVANVVNNWGYFVLLSWMPVYFKTVYNVNLKQAAWFSAIPWAVMAISGYIAGSSSDFLIKSGQSVTQVRKIMQSIGFIGPGISLLCLKYAQTPAVASVLMTVALSLSSFSQAGFLLNMQDIAPTYAGFLHGITNSMGTLAAIISTVGAGYFVQWLGSFQAFLTLTALLYFCGTVFWNLHATGEQVFF